MKLTQGTGRGTCWWNKLFLIFFVYIFFYMIKYIILQLNHVDVFMNFGNELIIGFLIYNFYKFFIFMSLNELI